MKRTTGLLLSGITLGGVLLAAYLEPAAQARETLPKLAANTIFQRSQSALQAGQFAETFRYGSTLWPKPLNPRMWTNLPLPAPHVTTMNFYDVSPTDWRTEQVTASGSLRLVTARQGNHLVVYRASTNRRTIMPYPTHQLVEFQTIGGMRWRPADLRKWKSNVSQTTLASTPAYQVTLTPRYRGTLFGAVTYWFQGHYLIPMGLQIRDRAGRVVYSIKAVVFTKGDPGASANPPTIGTLAAWSSDSELLYLGTTRHHASWTSFPIRLGSLPLTAKKVLGPTAIGFYGRGLGRVVAIESRGPTIPGRTPVQLFRPVSGFPGLSGMTEGAYSIALMRQRHLVVLLVGSRKLGTLAAWADQAWNLHRPSAK